MTVKELRLEAKKLGLKGYYKLNKSELEEAIKISQIETSEITENYLKKIVPDVEIIDYSSDEEWKQIRSNGIGGSDVGALLGVNKWRTPIDVFIDKTKGSEFSGNTFTHWGHMLENVVFKEFQSKHQELNCYTVPFTMKKGNAVANVDGMVFDKQLCKYGVLEIKTTSTFNSKEWEGEEIPQSYYAQVQHYLYVTGLDYAYIACLIGGNKYKEFFVERNEDDIKLISETIENFWNENILKNIPPMLDGSDSYSKYLLEMSEKENDEVIEIEDLSIKAEEYKHLKSQIEDLEKQLKVKEQEIIKEMNDNSCKKAKAGDYKFNIVTTNRKSVDKKLMEKENKELVTQYKEVEKLYTTEKSSSFLKVS